jgi:hypothetical protein
LPKLALILWSSCFHLPSSQDYRYVSPWLDDSDVFFFFWSFLPVWCRVVIKVGVLKSFAVNVLESIYPFRSISGFLIYIKLNVLAGLMPIILASWEAEMGRIWGQPRQITCETPISKITRAKWTGGVAQTVESLLCKHEAPSSNPRITKKKKSKIGCSYFRCI